MYFGFRSTQPMPCLIGSAKRDIILVTGRQFLESGRHSIHIHQPDAVITAVSALLRK